jgi:hypothetical protein
MGKEQFLSGYCRVLDGSRTVCVETEGGELLDADCCYGSCLYQRECPIARSIEALLQE